MKNTNQEFPSHNAYIDPTKHIIIKTKLQNDPQRGKKTEESSFKNTIAQSSLSNLNNSQMTVKFGDLDPNTTIHQKASLQNHLQTQSLSQHSSSNGTSAKKYQQRESNEFISIKNYKNNENLGSIYDDSQLQSLDNKLRSKKVI